MLNETIKLKDSFDCIESEATLTAFIHDVSDQIEPGRCRAGVLVCPGGGYGFTSDREAEPIALAFFAAGYNTFVLRYTTKTEAEAPRYPIQLTEASAAMVYIRRNADKYHIKPDAVAVCGFSSGGHLAASLATLWKEKEVEDALGISHGENRPDGAILGYPVITADPDFAHKGSFNVLLGEDKDPDLLKKLSIENSVDCDTPPVFLWHTLNDQTVHSQNSFMLADALCKNNIPFEMHIYPDGSHGLALANRETKSSAFDRINPHVESWFELCLRWFSRYIDNKGA